MASLLPRLIADPDDADEWPITTNRRQLTEAVRRLLADIAPDKLHDLEHTPIPDAPDGVFYSHLPNTVDELIDHIMEQQR
jgi:hypothetical protein